MIVVGVNLLDRCWCGLALVWVDAGVAQCDETGLWSSDWSLVCGHRTGARSEE